MSPKPLSPHAAFLKDHKRVNSYLNLLAQEADENQEVSSIAAAKLLRTMVDESAMSKGVRANWPYQTLARIPRLKRIDDKRRFRILKRAPRPSRGEGRMHAPASAPVLVPMESRSLYDQIDALKRRIEENAALKKHVEEVEAKLVSTNEQIEKLRQEREELAGERREALEALQQHELTQDDLLAELERMLASEGVRLA